MDHEVQSLGKAAALDAEPSFTELRRRSSEIPDGPSGVLSTPKPYRVLNIGGVGETVALLPFVFVKLMTRKWGQSEFYS